jgi:heat-inducible transcriptional repressor
MSAKIGAMEHRPELNEREQAILQAVVHTFITSAEPVGSRSIVKRYGLDLSPATVRNVMADLEDRGFVRQLHTSSGRVPTQQGYRYYVDYLMRVQELTLGERQRIEQELSRQLSDADEVLRQTSHLLALVSHQAGIVEAPQESEAEVRTIELMLVSAQRLAVLVADNYGRVRTVMVLLDEPVTADELPPLRAFLNQHLRNVRVSKLLPALTDKIARMQDEEHLLAERAMRLVAPLGTTRPGQLYLEGATQLFEQPEFADPGKAREVLTLLEERDRLTALLREGLGHEGARQLVVIGEDSEAGGLGELSVVASPYYVGERRAGMVGVLGPRRMPYSKLSGLVDYTARIVSRFLTKLAG